MSSAIRQHKTKSDTQRKIQLSRDAYSLIWPTRLPSHQGSRDRKFRWPTGPRFSIFCWFWNFSGSWSGPVLGPNRSVRDQPVVVRGFLFPIKNLWSHDFKQFEFRFWSSSNYWKWIKNEIRIEAVTRESERVHFWSAPRYKLNNCCSFVF